MAKAERSDMSLLATEILTPRYELAWYPWAVQYFFMIALSYSALLLTLPGLVFRRKRFVPLARLALLVSVTCAVVGPVALLADLHQPARFWHFYASPAPWSWMSIGSLLLPPYVVLMLVYGWLAWRPALIIKGQGPAAGDRLARWISLGRWQAPRWALMAVGLLATLFAVGVMIYTGAELAIIKARPLWNTQWLPVMLVMTGLISAAGLVLVLNRFMNGGNPDVNRQGVTVILLALVGSAVVAAAWFVEGLTGYSASVEAALESVRDNPDWLVSAVWALTAGVVLFLLAAAMRRFQGWLVFAWVAGLLAVHMGWAFRWMVLMDVQTVAKNTAGFYQLVVEAGSYGLMGIIGTFGLWLAALLIIDIIVPWRETASGAEYAHS